MKAIIHANIWKNDLDALVIDDGIIQRIDSTESILKEITENDEVIDLKGSFVLPGFIDNHMHLLKYGFYKSILSLEYANNTEDIKKALLEHLPQEKDKWLISKKNELKLITKDLLDDVSKEKPIVVIDFNSNSIVVNSKAMEISGITESITYEHGLVNYEKGFIQNQAAQLILSNYEVKDSDLKNYLSVAMKECNHYGITTVCSDDFTSLTNNYVKPLDLYSKESYQGNLTLHIFEQCSFNTIEDFANFLDEGYATGIGEDYFEIGPLQMELDDTNNNLYYEDEELQEIIHLASTYNTPTICITHSSKAINQSLKVYKDEVLEGNPLGYSLINTSELTDEQINKIKQMNLNYICNGYSEAPSNNPDVLNAIYSLITNNKDITVNEAISIYTEVNAKVINHSDTLGKVQEGYEADLVVLDKDITKCDKEDILKIKVLMTLVSGNEVYSR